MKKSALRALLFLLICALLLPCTVLADTGPKPSMDFTLCGMPQEEYYIAMLGQEPGWGPHHTPQPGELPADYLLEEGSEEADSEVWQRFAAYEDTDGFYFWDDIFAKRSGDDTVRWGYYPPETFKLLLYFPQSDTFLVSGVYSRYAFRSYFTLDLAGVAPEDTVQPLVLSHEGAEQPSQLVPFLLRAAVTILIEGGIALLFGYRTRRQLLSVIGVNLITQVLLNLGLAWAGGSADGYFTLYLAYFGMELLVFLLEALVYIRLLLPAAQRQEAALRGRVIRYALTANAASFVLGLLLSRFLPTLF